MKCALFYVTPQILHLDLSLCARRQISGAKYRLLWVHGYTMLESSRCKPFHERQLHPMYQYVMASPATPSILMDVHREAIKEMQQALSRQEVAQEVLAEFASFATLCGSVLTHVLSADVLRRVIRDQFHRFSRAVRGPEGTVGEIRLLNFIMVQLLGSADPKSVPRAFPSSLPAVSPASATSQC